MSASSGDLRKLQTRKAQSYPRRVFCPFWISTKSCIINCLSFVFRRYVSGHNEQVHENTLIAFTQNVTGSRCDYYSEDDDAELDEPDIVDATPMTGVLPQVHPPPDSDSEGESNLVLEPTSDSGAKVTVNTRSEISNSAIQTETSNEAVYGAPVRAAPNLNPFSKEQTTGSGIATSSLFHATSTSVGIIHKTENTGSCALESHANVNQENQAK